MHPKLTDQLNPKLTEDQEMLHQEQAQKVRKLSLASNNEDPTRRVAITSAEEGSFPVEERENLIEDLALVEDQEKTRRVALVATTGALLRMIALLNPKL
jgi:hypothetical protein